MYNFLTPLFLAAAAVVPFAQAYSDPGSCKGACWAHDPAIMHRESDGMYFKFNTGGFIEIATSSSLSGTWTLQGYVLTADSIISNSGNDDLWVCREIWPPLPALADPQSRHPMSTSWMVSTTSIMLSQLSRPKSVLLDLLPVQPWSPEVGQIKEAQESPRRQEAPTTPLIPI